MATIFPFQGLRYADQLAARMDRLVTPPYDIISAREQDRFYRVHRHNIIRLELGKTSAGDDTENNRYTRAAATLKNWLASGVLQADAKPAYYLVKTDYCDPQGGVRHFTGLFGRVKLEPLGEGKVLPHEKTFEGPKTDRYNLLRETGVSFSPVLALYRDRNQAVAGLLAKAARRRPVADFKDWCGHRHRLWLITSPAEHAALASAFRPKQLLIADGHHRYSTALRYQRECGGEAGPAAGQVMMCLAETRDPGLTVLPVFRLIRGVAEPKWRAFGKGLEKNFQVQPVADLARLCEFQQRMTRALKRPVIACLGPAPKTASLLALRREAAAGKLFAGPHAHIQARLDVFILNQLILKDLLGISPGEEKDRVSYTKCYDEARDALARGVCQAAFLPGLPNLEAIWDLARQGETMPQKSTYFLPKIITGLVMNPVCSETGKKEI